MNGICVAVNATTSTSGSSRYTTLKLWKSLPAAPMISTRFVIHRAFRFRWSTRESTPASRGGAESLRDTESGQPVPEVVAGGRVLLHARAVLVPELVDGVVR